MLANIKGINSLLTYAKKEKSIRVLYISFSEVYGQKLTYELYVEGIYGVLNIASMRS